MSDDKHPWAEPRFQSARWIALLHERIGRTGSMRWPVGGRSMLPTLPPGSEIEVVPLPEHVPLGAILLFTRGHGAVVHRLVGRKGPLYLTQADGHERSDAAVRAAQIIGVVRTAWQDGEQVWPTRWEPMLRWKWLLRYGWLRWRRGVARRLRKQRR